MVFDYKNIRLWIEAAASVFHRRVITMFFFGFSAGMPLLLIFSSLSLWLREAGVERSAVTFFSWAALGYSFKFIWAPVVDIIPVFVLSKILGRRRGWILLSQLLIIGSICIIAFTDPSKTEMHVYISAIGAVMLGFSAATQDIVIDAYRIESAGVKLQAMMASSYIAGYRGGMLAAGAGALFAADYLGSSQGNYDYSAWKYTYLIMAALMLIGVATTLIIKEPETKINKVFNRTASDYFGSFVVFIISVCVFAGVFYYTNSFFSGFTDLISNFVFNGYMAGFVSEALRLCMAIFSGVSTAYFFGKTKLVNQEMIKVTYIEPVKDFFDRYGLKLSFILLSLIGLYRISDIVLGVISNLFYQDLGFTKTEIAAIVKTYGLFMTIAGGFLGGILAQRLGVLKILFAGAFLSAVTNLLFMILAYSGKDMFMLYVVISADNLAGGLATASFVAFLSSLTNIKFTAVQYAVFSSLMTLIPKLFGGYSGTIVDSLGYESFFLITAAAGIPVLFLVGFAGKYLKLEKK